MSSSANLRLDPCDVINEGPVREVMVMKETRLSFWDRGQDRCRWRLAGLTVLGMAMISVAGCGEPSSSPGYPSDPQVILQAYQERPRLEGTAEVVLQIRTARAGQGTLLITLEGEDAPLTAGHFADLVRQGFYDGLQFFRVEKDPEPFVVHAGDAESASTPLQEISGPQPQTIPLEIKLREEPQPRYNMPLAQPSLSQDLALPHRLGAVAMARSSAPDSATSQFYISLSALPILDGRFAVFGYVTEGMPLVDQIEVGDVIESAWIKSGLENLIYPEPDPQLVETSPTPQL